MKIGVTLCLLVAIISCASPQGRAGSSGPNERELTAGLVQLEIRPGMTGAEVASALGSPNIVTRDEQGKEVWVYDKVASEATYRNSSTQFGVLGGVAAEAGSTLLLGIPSFGYNGQQGEQALSQKTLTVVIRFDGRSRVESASFHSTRF